MADYDNTNRGVLFKNKDKQADTHADSNGTINVDGVEYFLNAWKNTSKNGTPYLSLTVKRKDKQPVTSGGNDDAPAAAPAGTNDDFDDDVPF